MQKISYKTEAEIKIMAEGGKRLAEIRAKLAEKVHPGGTGWEIEELANKLIKEAGGEASFKMVEGYDYATCININDVVVHGIPNKEQFREGDIVGIDIGLYYKGYHSDAAVTVGVGSIEPGKQKFLEVGRKGLKEAIAVVKPGRHIGDISAAMQASVENYGYSAVRALTGHGIGKHLHEEPAIPCFSIGDSKHSPKLIPGMVLAIEIMYNEGDFDVVYKNDDGWTIVTADGKISGLFEENIAVTDNGYQVLTQL